MSESMKYAIFDTKWGYFGIVVCSGGLLRSSLPVGRYEDAAVSLLRGLGGAHRDRSLFGPLQYLVKSYFEGGCVRFGSDIPLVFDGFSSFARLVYSTCRNIGFGQRKSYSELSISVGCPGSARAVGRVLAHNPLPLIVPCHRVICADGRIGGFSAAGGPDLKKRMLEHERLRP